MKTKIICVFLAIMTIGIYVIQNNQPEFGELVQANVEALSFNEWGGGNQVGDEIIQYEYEQINFFYKYCKVDEYAPFEWCSCYSKTCHGYGEEFCFGILDCFPVNGNDPDLPDPSNPYEPPFPYNP